MIFSENRIPLFWIMLQEGLGVLIWSRDIRALRAGMIAACTFALLLAASPAGAAKRIALVIGNNAYENVPQLQKAVNDACRRACHKPWR